MSIREARIIFKVGKNRDGFFDADDLLRQVDKAIDIFEGLTRAGLKACSYSTMCPAIKSVHWTPYQQETW
jgi:hypothetical protein